MSSNNNNAHDSDMTEVVHVLRVSLERAHSDLAEAKEWAATYSARVKRLERALSALTEEPTHAPKVTPKKSAPYRGTVIGTERLDEILSAIREVDNDGFTQVEVRDVTGMSSSVMSAAFRILRERKVIRYAGVTDNHRKLFKLYVGEADE